ncbi:MAG: helix-turn-helix domain-containing protein [Pseudonocardiaceae bacterium]
MSCARYRNLAKLSLTEASTLTAISKAKLGYLETGRQVQASDDIAHVLSAYGAAQRDIDRLTSLTGQAAEATWWAPWAQVVPDWFKTLDWRGKTSRRVLRFHGQRHV